MDDLIWKQLQYCKRHTEVPDLHSFTVNVRDGISFVEVRTYGECFIETKTRKSAADEEKTVQWCGTLVAAANRLEMLGADPGTISM